jgi:integrase
MAGMTLSQLLRYFEASALVEENTRAKCRVAVAKYKLLCGDPSVESIGAGEIGRWQLLMKQGGLSVATIRSYFGAVSQVFSWAVEQRLLAVNPWLLAKRVKPLKRDVVIFTKEEMIDLVEAAASLGRKDPSAQLRWTAILLLASRSGLRIGEIENLRWEDIDLDARCVHVQWRPDRFGEYWLWGTKGRTDRWVPISQSAAECLSRLQVVATWRYPLLKRATCERLQGLVGSIPEALRKRPYQDLYREFGQVRRKANGERGRRGMPPIKNGCLHTMRKTAVSLWARRGVSMWDAQYAAGHRSPDTTQTYYVAVEAAASVASVGSAIDRE